MESPKRSEVELAFNTLTDNGPELTKELFVRGMKKHRVPLFTGLKPDAPDYDACCEELFNMLLSQMEPATLESSTELRKAPEPVPVIPPQEPDENLPSHLNFLAESHESIPFGGPAAEKPENKAGALCSTISLDQFKYTFRIVKTCRSLFDKSLFVKSIVDGIMEALGKHKPERTTIADKIIGYMQKSQDKGNSESEIVRTSCASMKSSRAAVKASSRYVPTEDPPLAKESPPSSPSLVKKVESPFVLAPSPPTQAPQRKGTSGEEDDFRISDVVEESKDKRVAKVESIKQHGFHLNPFLRASKECVSALPVQVVTPPPPQRRYPGRAPRFEIRTKNSIGDVSCNYFLEAKLNKMCDYIAQNMDCSIF